jgi:hypothetical protein
MTRDEDEIGRALKAAVPPARVPPGLADRSFRAAMAAAPDPFAERFVQTGWRAALVGAVATALVWGGLLLRDPAPDASTTASAQLDVAEAALSLWTGEEAVLGE